jgi:hypothetical protein
LWIHKSKIVFSATHNDAMHNCKVVFVRFLKLGKNRGVTTEAWNRGVIRVRRFRFTLFFSSKQKVFAPNFPVSNKNKNKQRTLCVISGWWLASSQNFSGSRDINSKFLRLDFLSGFLSSFFHSTKCCSWIDSSFLVLWIFLDF